jgi:hypothetical protein
MDVQMPIVTTPGMQARRHAGVDLGNADRRADGVSAGSADHAADAKAAIF